jgi:hypothetical protein
LHWGFAEMVKHRGPFCQIFPKSGAFGVQSIEIPSSMAAAAFPQFPNAVGFARRFSVKLERLWGDEDIVSALSCDVKYFK